MSMFCYQCEQTAGGCGCTKMGVCGKDETTANLQDELILAIENISMYAARTAKLGKIDQKTGKFVIESLFTTVTNVNFDPERIQSMLDESDAILAESKKLYIQTCNEKGIEPEKIVEIAGYEIPFIESRKKQLGADIVGLEELIMYGLKGTAAYADHAAILGKQSDEVYAFFFEALDFLTSKDAENIDKLTAMALKVGEVNLKVMEMLDAANTETYGHPEPTVVKVTPVKGKCILVSGHDLKDLYELCEQTQGKGINIYTHGEMLPCLAYPELKKFKHLVGNYGGAWQDQRKEFDEFPGAILMTTNCIQKPKETYMNRIFTTGLVAWKNVVHIKDKNFKPVIDAALAAEGFKEDAPEKTITIGFARNAVMSVADKVIEAVKAGKIKHFFLVGGCDGAKSGRNYYTEFAQLAPKDTVILTLACGKYRFNKLEFGDIGGIPRLLDIGQCNDAYSAIQIAVALAKAFNCGVNDLPLSIILSWYEQKAVCILLTLLYLNIQNMRIGPSLPAFISPAVLGVLVDKFNIKPVTTAEQDLKEILG